jgi:negative modulator of initiation of replication
MRTIDVDDDVFFALESISGFTKIPIPQVVRQLVPSTQSNRGAVGPKSAPPQVARASPEDQALREYVRTPNFLANRSVVDQWLSIFSFLHKQYPEKFEILESMEGRKRKYVARTEEELERFGTSVNAKRIPGTGFWVVTNNDTNNKKVLLRQALTLLGYGPETIRVVPECLR